MKYVTIEFGRNMKFVAILLFALVLISGCYGDQSEDVNTQLSHFIADLWLEGADVIKILWRDCSKKLVDAKDVIDHREYFPKFVRCMKRKSLRALDRSLGSDVVPVFNGINLVRYEFVDRSGNVVMENDTSTWTEKEIEEKDWRTLALQRMAKVLRTHVIKFDLDDEKIEEKGAAEFRGRRRHHMMTMMMFGIVSIGMVLVPMGFQFLAVLGGKALLLAKFALILASIQGLKKIAASPLSYGFYHTYPPYEPYEKRSNDLWPAPVSPVTSTILPNQRLDSEKSSNKINRKHYKEHSKGDHNKDRVNKNVVRESSERNVPDVFESEPRLYPVYSPTFEGIDAPSPLTDLTTTPGEVQADYALELPYNGFRFQSPTTVVSA